MSNLVAELNERALTLAPEDRARLAESLLASLHVHDAGVEAAWDAEIRRRVQDIEDGTADLTAADDAFADVRHALK
jgi:putative addiction module component (TIGR02574 family)